MRNEKENKETQKKNKPTIRLNKNINMSRIMIKIVILMILLYMGETVITETGRILNGTTNPLYQGLGLIGWTVDENGTITGTNTSGILAMAALLLILLIITEELINKKA